MFDEISFKKKKKTPSSKANESKFLDSSAVSMVSLLLLKSSLSTVTLCNSNLRDSESGEPGFNATGIVVTSKMALLTKDLEVFCRRTDSSLLPALQVQTFSTSEF